MNQERKPHSESSIAKLESLHGEETRVLQEYLELVLEVKEEILSSLSNEKASSRFSVEEVSNELMYMNLLEDLLQTDGRVSGCRVDFNACNMILYHKQPKHSCSSMKTTEQKYEGVATMNLFCRELRDTMSYYNPDEPNRGYVVIRKVISLSDEDFWFFGENIKQEASFIMDNEELRYFDQQTTLHCLFIQKEGVEFGALINRNQKSGEVYSGYLPDLDQFREIGCEISEKEDHVEPQM